MSAADGQRALWIRLVVAEPTTDLPILNHQFSFRQARHLPRLPAAPILIDIRVSECNESQGEIATIETLRVPTDRDDWLRGIAVC
jgi:hypothetical protein